MKILITASGNKLNSEFDKRFGRAAWFCVYDDQTGLADFIENDHLNASNGAGTKAAEMVVELEVNKVISGHFGPKAKDLLDKFNIQLETLQGDNLIVETIIEKLKL